MASRYYESSTSGMNFDRFLDRFDDSTLVTMKKHYWTAKQLLRSKLGKKEDEHLLASDADLDSKLTLFRSVRDTSENLLACIENYQSYLYDATLCENELGRYLKDQGKREKREETAMVMIALGRAILFSSHQRAAVRQPIVRFYQELHVFAERAIADCSSTVEAVERARLEYRGSLLWMKKTSEELDPDTDRQLEKFREVQQAVRSNKERLDKLKVDTLQKVDLLSASRSNLLCHLLGKYLEMLISFYEKTGKAYTALAANLSVFQHYEFEILTDLIEPSKRVAKKVRQESLDKERKDVMKEKTSEDVDESETNPSDVNVANLLNFDDEPDDSLKKFLFGRESPVEEKKETGEEEEERTDSPLGVLEEGEEAQEDDKLGAKRKSLFGPLAPRPIPNCAVPRLAPPPKADPAALISSASTSNDLLSLEDSSSDFLSQNLFVPSQNPSSIAGSALADLLQLSSSTSATTSAFPNPFDESKTSEWDLLLSQCDIQQSNDLI